MNDFYSPYEPINALKPFIRSLFVADHYQDVQLSTPPVASGYNYFGWVFAGHVMANVGGEMMADLLGKFHFAGQLQRQDVTVNYSGKCGHILAQCTATGFYALTHVTGEEINGKADSMSTMNVDAAAKVERHFASASSFARTLQGREGRIRVFQQALLPLVDDAIAVPDYVQNAVDRLEEANGVLKIKNLIIGMDVSQRQLDRQFKKIIGVTPKYFSQVLQMNTALAALYANNTEHLADLAQEAGYYDQSHFVKVMRHFFEKSPNEFLASDTTLLSTFLGRSK